MANRYQWIKNLSATLAGANCIITRNKKDFKESSLPIYSVAEFFETIKKEEKRLR